MSRRFSILVVDDDESTRKFLHSVLEAEGHNCQLAGTLGSAEALLRRQKRCYSRAYLPCLALPAALQ